MSQISSECAKETPKCRARVLLLAAAGLGAASAGCVDPAAGREPPSGLPTVEHVSPGGAGAPRSLRAAVEQIRSKRVEQSVNVAAFTCNGPFTITSQANGLLVSAELGYTGGDAGMLRARASALGPWEQYTLCFDDADGTFIIQSNANGLLVSAELGYTGGDAGMLRARANAIGPWERFFIDNFGTFATITSAANGLLVSAELGYTGDDAGMLRARATAIGPWEQFQ